MRSDGRLGGWGRRSGGRGRRLAKIWTGAVTGCVGEAGAAIDDEGADPTARCFLPIGAARIGERHDGVADTAIGDQILDAVEPVVVALLLIGAGHLQRIAAGIRFGQAEGQDLLALGGSRQVAAFLVLVAVGQDGIFADRRVPGEEGPHAGPLPADADQRTRIGDRVGTAAAGTDYTATSGTVTFPAYEKEATVTVSVTGDGTSEANETFALDLVSETEGIDAAIRAWAMIANDDTTGKKK